MKINPKYFLFAALIAFGLAIRIPFIWHPPEVVFDEVHFGKFVSAYYTGEHYFDIHPPLGKLLIAGFVSFFGFSPGFDFEVIGAEYGDIPYAALRFLPNLAGALIPVAVAGMLLALGVPKAAGFLAGALLAIDNALLTQSRFILVDSFLMFFGFAGLWLFFRARNRGYPIVGVILAGIVLAMSFSVKWTGLAFFGLAAGVMMWDRVGEHALRLLLRRRTPVTRSNSSGFFKTLRTPVLFIGTALAVYLAVFVVHFALLPYPGPGDAFMSANFSEKPLLVKIGELNLVMLAANEGLTATHPDASPAWSWPLMARPIFYWVQSVGEGVTARIYLLGNPAVWWLSTLGVLIAIFAWRPRSPQMIQIKWILYFGWLINLLPFLGIGRVMFLYHYLPALGFAVAILATWMRDALTIKQFKLVSAGVVVIAALAFVFFAPLSYGFPLTETEYQARLWLPSWVR